MRVGGTCEHANVGAGTKHIRFARAQHDYPYFRVFKAHALNNVCQFNINSQIIGIQF